jgi:hypothetical protein
VSIALIVGVGACAHPPGGLDDAFRHPEFPDRTAPAGTYPWAEPNDPAAVRISPPDKFRDALVVGDVIVVSERVGPAPRIIRVRGVDPKGRVLFTGPAVAVEPGQSDSPGLHLLGDPGQVRVAFAYHKTGPGGRLAYADIYDLTARGQVKPHTVRLPTDDRLEWAGSTAIQGALRDDGGRITILDADGTLSPWDRPGWLPVAATADVVVDAHRGNDSRKQGFEVVDRRTRRVLWSSPGETVYAVSTKAIIAGHTRAFRLLDLHTGTVIAHSTEPLSQGGTWSGADGTRQQGDLLMTSEVVGNTRHRWVHGGWNAGHYAIWKDNVYGFQDPENSADDNPMALWIPPSGTPYRFPVTGHAAPLGVTTDGHAIALTGSFRDRALYVIPLRH